MILLRILPILLTIFCSQQKQENLTQIDRSVGIEIKSSPNLPFASGVLVDSNKILTVFHAVAGHEKDLQIREKEGQVYSLKVLRKEFLFDLALLEMENLKLRHFPFESITREDLNIGDRVYLFGAPYGLSHSYKEGYISHLDRKSIDPTYPDLPFIQTYGLSDPGTSGGGVFTMDGKFVGIQRANFGYQAGGEAGLVIPATFVKVFLQKN